MIANKMKMLTFAAVLLCLGRAFGSTEVLALGTPDGEARLTLGSAEVGFAVQDLSFGETSFFRKKGGDVPLWKLVFSAGVNGEKRTLSSDKVPQGRLERTNVGVDLVWTGIDLETGDKAVDVVCGIATNAADARYEFTIRVRNRSARFGLFSTDYPRVSSVVLPESGSAIIPVGNWGAQRHRKLAGPARAFYPSYRCPLQFAAFETSDDKGVMFQALDDEACQKYVCVDTAFGFSIETPAENAGRPGAAQAPRFAVALSPYVGAWWPAAKRYRAWAVKNAPWLAKGPIAKRSDFPAQMRNGGFWYRAGANGETPAQSEAYVNRVVDRVAGKVPVSVHWYCWHKHPFDTCYPDFFPARDGFKDTVSRLVAKGVMVMPYVNGRIWDQLEPGFAAVKPFACLQAGGEPYEEVWNKRKFSAMCPAVAFWQDLMQEVGDRLVAEYGVNAFYYDQIASMTPVTCYAENHPHAPGGGRHWVDGYRQLIRKVRSRHPGKTMTSENFSEPYVDLIDGFLTWSPNLPEDLPGIAAIYSGYLATMACSAAPEYTIEAFRATQGRSFLWGCQCGWLSSWIVQEKQRDKFDYLLKLAIIRQAALDFFTDGELVGDVANRAETPRLKFKWKRWSKDIDVEMPAVQATRWRNPAGKELVAVVNYSSERQRFDGGSGVGTCDLEPGDVRLIRLQDERTK